MICGYSWGMDFKTFYRQMAPEKRDEFAKRVGTTPGYCHQIAYGKRLELGLADAMVAIAPEFGGSLSLDDLNLTDRARAQDKVRRSGPGQAANSGWDGVDRRHAGT